MLCIHSFAWAALVCLSWASRAPSSARGHQAQVDQDVCTCWAEAGQQGSAPQCSCLVKENAECHRCERCKTKGWFVWFMCIGSFWTVWWKRSKNTKGWKCECFSFRQEGIVHISADLPLLSDIETIVWHENDAKCDWTCLCLWALSESHRDVRVGDVYVRRAWCSKIDDVNQCLCCVCVYVRQRGNGERQLSLGMQED